MKKLLLFSFLLFWWCLMFPSSSYTTVNEPYTSYSFSIGNKEIRFRLFDLLFE